MDVLSIIPWASKSVHVFTAEVSLVWGCDLELCINTLIHSACLLTRHEVVEVCFLCHSNVWTIKKQKHTDRSTRRLSEWGACLKTAMQILCFQGSAKTYLAFTSLHLRVDINFICCSFCYDKIGEVDLENLLSEMVWRTTMKYKCKWQEYEFTWLHIFAFPQSDK